MRLNIFFQILQFKIKKIILIFSLKEIEAEEGRKFVAAYRGDDEAIAKIYSEMDKEEKMIIRKTPAKVFGNESPELTKKKRSRTKSRTRYSR